jgi:hypothetical protein
MPSTVAPQTAELRHMQEKTLPEGAKKPRENSAPPEAAQPEDGTK